MGDSWRGRHAWAWRSAAALWATRHGSHGGACLEVAHGNDLLPQPDLESEGAGSPAEDGVGSVVERIERGTMQLLRTQTRQALRILARSSLVSWRLKLCLGKEKAGAFKDLKKKLKLCQQKFHLLAKNKPDAKSGPLRH
jgi:hypothetical protein